MDRIMETLEELLESYDGLTLRNFGEHKCVSGTFQKLCQMCV
jgi:proline dehydrogenase